MSAPTTPGAPPAIGEAAEGRGADRGPWLAGALGGAIGALCCAGPAIGIALGLGAGSFLVGLADRRFLLFGIGALVAAVIVAMTYRRQRRSCPTPEAAKALRGRFLDAAILAFGITYLVGRVVVPRLIDALT
jgi:chromate transport protein ChrA